MRVLASLKEKIRLRLIQWLADDIQQTEQKQIKYALSAVIDLHLVKVPFNNHTLTMAFDNALAFEELIDEGQASLQDRRDSLVTIFNRRLQADNVTGPVMVHNSDGGK